MNVFEDLIETLKEENLLESTVIDDQAASNGRKQQAHTVFESRTEDGADNLGFATGSDDGAKDFEQLDDIPVIEGTASPREFYRKRAMDEVSSLQMVEHILSGVEREHMKVVPAPFDDIKVKQALHRFSQINDSSDASEAAAAEYELMHQTQGWFTALSERDKHISVGNIRRFVENSRPALSSQAMIALARFYRNAPYSDATRSKFDFVMSRLFTREVEGGHRRLLFSRTDMVGHIRTLYENWSSIEAYTLADDGEAIDAASGRFREFVDEVEGAASLDALVSSSFFDRVRDFKDELGELFFAREVTAAAIAANMRIGNRFIELVAAAHEKDPALFERFGDTLDHLVSNTAGRTLLLADILEAMGDRPVARTNVQTQSNPQRPAVKAVEASQGRSSIFSVNKWLLAFGALIISLCVGAYFWADKIGGDTSSMKVATEIDISMTDLKQHLQKARSSNETLYGVTAPSWDALTEDDKKAFMKQVIEFAEKRGLSKVNLLNYRGRTVAFSNKYRFEILPPA